MAAECIKTVEVQHGDVIEVYSSVFNGEIRLDIYENDDLKVTLYVKPKQAIQLQSAITKALLASTSANE